MPLAHRSWAMLRLPSPPMMTSASTRASRSAAISSSERSSSTGRPSGSDGWPLERIAPVGRAEDGAAQVGDAADLVGAERHEAVRVGHLAPFRSAPDAGTSSPRLSRLPKPRRIPAQVQPRAVADSDHRANHRVESGSVPAPGRDGDLHGRYRSESGAPGPLGAHGFDHFARLRVTSNPLLGEHDDAVHGHLENSAAPGNQLDLDSRKRLGELGRHPGGPWLVVSNDAVGDRGSHGGQSSRDYLWCHAAVPPSRPARDFARSPIGDGREPASPVVQANGPPPRATPPRRDSAHSPSSRKANVGSLRVLWTFATGSLRAHEGNPLVAGGRLYLHTPHPVTVYAFDLDRPGDAAALEIRARQHAIRRRSSAATAWSGDWPGIPSGKLYVPLYPGDLVAVDAATRQGDLARPRRRSGARHHAQRRAARHRRRGGRSGWVAANSARGVTSAATMRSPERFSGAPIRPEPTPRC